MQKTKDGKATKNQSAPLTLADVNAFATELGVFFSRLRATVAESERGREVEARLARVGLFLSPDGAVTADSSKPNGAANGSAMRHSVRRPLPIDRAAIISVVGSAGKAGVTAGEIADKLHLEVRRLRPVLWQIRDAGEVRATGKLSTTRYVAPISRTPKTAARATSAAPSTTPAKNGKKAKQPATGKKTVSNKAKKSAASTSDSGQAASQS